MIVKELDPFHGKKSSDFTGRKAEEERNGVQIKKKIS